MTRSKPSGGHHYRLFGLTLHSTLELPELTPGEPGDAGTVEIVLGEVAEPPGAASGALVATPEGAVLIVSGVGRFGIRDGREITVDPHPDVSARNLRLFVLGSVMGALLHQRGILPLHANAIELGGRAVAFLGHSGAGKSTLAAAFHDRGHRILSDDVCAITQGPKGFMAQPGIPRLRLWRDAVERSGRETDSYERAFDALDKFTIGTGSDARADPMPPGAIYLLRSGQPEAPLEIRRLSGVEAAQALIENTYRGAFIRTLGDPRAHFETCLALSRAVPVFEITRPWDPARIDELIARIEAHLSGVL